MEIVLYPLSRSLLPDNWHISKNPVTRIRREKDGCRRPVSVFIFANQCLFKGTGILQVRPPPYDWQLLRLSNVEVEVLDDEIHIRALDSP